MTTQSQHEPEHEHVKILREIMAQFGTLFDRCPDGIYVYIDDVHKTCNEKLAKMHGTTVDEWQRCESIVDTYAEPEDRAVIVNHYMQTVQGLGSPVRFQYRARRQDGSVFMAELDMVPFTWGGNSVALHFVREVKK
jgi:PAS domain S-box-containing protein